MNHVVLRRIALAVASASLGTLTALVMIGSTISGQMHRVSAEEIQAQYKINYSTDDADDISIPISCTPLVIENLLSYDGKFNEDGSGREVQDVAAIMLYNSNNTVVPYAWITVYTENIRYTFNAHMIPPNSSVLVPEENGKKLTETEIIKTFGWTTVKENVMRATIEIEEIGMGCLRITNRSGCKVQNLTLYHRTYISDGSFYMGGKAFQTEIPYIAPGNTVLVYPSNYVSGYSKVVYYE